MANTTEPQCHRIAVIDEGGSCRITPREILAGRGDTVEFFNITGGNITLMLPDPGLLGATNYLISGGTGVRLPVSGTAPIGTHAYTVFCDSIKEFAQASIPRIIIYPNIP